MTISDVLLADQAAYLLAHRVATLATVDATGCPHAVPVCFALVNGYLYSPLDRKPKRVPAHLLRRVRDLATNPAVCLTVDTYDENWQHLRWLQLRGEATVIAPGAEQVAAIAALRERYPQYATMQLEDLPVIRIVPRRVVEWAWTMQ